MLKIHLKPKNSLFSALKTGLLCGTLFFVSPNGARGQQSHVKNGYDMPSYIGKPDHLATHPLGIFFYRPVHNFQSNAVSKVQVAFQWDSGNIWGQQVQVFLPRIEATRKKMAALAFYERIYNFDEMAPSDQYTLAYDGVLKQFRLNTRFALGKESEMQVTLRGATLTRGKAPFSWLTSDRFIEWFHSKVVGGEDPFARKATGMDSAGLSYADRNQNKMEVPVDQFFIAGVETAFYRYFKLGMKDMFSGNIGIHLGYNGSAYNRSLDLGLSGALIADLPISQTTFWRFGQSVNGMRKALLVFNAQQVDFGTNDYMMSAESSISYVKTKPKDGFWSLGISFYVQTPYNKRKEQEYYVPYNKERLGRWHDAASHFYRFPNLWSMYYSFGRRCTYSVYVSQDFTVNNAPDFQAGVKFAFFL